MTKLKATTYHESGRTNKVLINLSTNYSRPRIQLWLKNGMAFVSGQSAKADHEVEQGDEITALIPEPGTLDVASEDIPLTIVYEDEDVVVVDKPQGMVVHLSAGHTHGTIVNALIRHIKNPSTTNGVIRPDVIHRIDKDTSGLLMVARSDQVYELLAQQLGGKTSLRKYVALVHGEIPREEGAINVPIGHSKEDRKMQVMREDGKSAVTHLTVLKRLEEFTLVELKLETGGTHQIRVCMKYIGYPLAGDSVYGPRKTLKGNGQFLHVRMLGFTHPTTNEEMTFEAPLPEVFGKTLEKLRKNITL